jgi:hypothetical protein
MRNLTVSEVFSDLDISVVTENQGVITLIGFNFKTLIVFDFDKAEQGCHTRRNGDPGWPSIPAQAYINRIALIDETTFSSGDADEDDYVSKTLPVGTDILQMISGQFVRKLEDRLAEEMEETC